LRKKRKSNLHLKTQSVLWVKNFLKLVNKKLIGTLEHRGSKTPLPTFIYL
jgi:hypothetical protein